MTTFVELYHPALPGTPHVRAATQAVPEYEARGWIVVDGSTPAPEAIYLTPGVGDLRYTKLGDVGDPATTTGAALRAALGRPVVTTVTTAGALAAQKHTPVDATSGPLTMTLPTGQPAGTSLSLEKVDASTNAVTVSGSIRGTAGTETLVGRYESMVFVADSAGSWWVDAGHKTKSWLSSQYGTVATEPLVTGPLPASLVTQGLYARTAPTPSGSSAGIVALANDPSVAGRVWVQGLSFSQLGFTDDHGATWTSKAVPPVSGVFGLYFAGGFAWLLQGPSAAKSGRLYRSPLPDASGNGLSWTLMFDLAAPPGAITTGDQATFRNSCVAISGANVYLLEYSVATITGGPSLYYSADSGATWAKVKTWANAKHGHAVKVIGGVPWAMIGDGGTAFTDIGLWNATTAAATTWARRSNYGEASGGNTLYGINMIPMNVGGQPMIVSEYDGSSNYGPIVFGSQSISVAKTLQPVAQLPAAYSGTMRQLTLTSEGNLMWLHTGEGGAVGALDSVWIAKGPHFTRPVLLEAISNTGNPFGTLGDPVEDGQYVWFGKYRCVKEKFLGQ